MIMKKWSQINTGNLLFGLFLLMSLVIGGTYFIESIMVLKLVLLLAIPIPASFYFLRQKELNVAIVSFLFFAFLGNVFSVIFIESNYVGISNMMYLMALVSLIFTMIPEFKKYRLRKNKWLMVYLLAMFAISFCFFFEISQIFSALLLNDVDFYVFVFQGASLLILGLLSFGVYLNNQSHSVFHFLLAVICFGFALSVNYISAFYLYDFIFELLSSLFYVGGLYFMFKFLLGENKVKVQKPIEDCEVFYSEIVFA